MNETDDTDPRAAPADAAADLARLKSEAEIEKLRLEAEDLRERIEKARKWYTGRFLFEALIGGVVAGALFVTWFVGFYAPSIDIEKDRLEFVKEREKERFDRELERQRHEKAGLLTQHLEFSESVSGGNKQLVVWVKKMRDRMRGRTRALMEKESEYDLELKAFFTYLDKESVTLDELVALLETDLSRGNDLARRYKDAIDKLDNTDFFITIVHDSEFEKLAYQAGDALFRHEFNVPKIWRWIDFREDGDPSMSGFFKDGPVLWYDKTHPRTNEKIASIKKALSDIFPDNMTLRRGDTLVVPGITWSPPQPYHVQLWLFQKR